MPSFSATGVTLSVHKYQGTQRIAAYLTRECGKVEATVSGVGKPGSKLAPAVEPLTLSRLYFAEGKGLDRLTQCEVIESFYDLRRDLTRLAWASYVAELVDETTEPGRPEPEVFDALVETLQAITAGAQVELTAWAFVVRYLCLHGLSPALDICVSCGCEVTGDGLYVCSLGGCTCPQCRSGGPDGLSAEDRATLSATNALSASPRARAALATLSHLPPGRLDRVKLAPGVLSEVRDLLRAHIRYHVGVRLRSEEFLIKLATATNSPAPPA